MVVPVYNCFHPVMRQTAKPIENIDGKTSELIENLYDTLYNISNGVGLAANQIGSLERALVIDVGIMDENPKPEPITMLNPVILKYSEDVSEEQEGCLSIPEFFEKVVRPAEIQVKYYDLDQKEYVREASGFIARVMQHEIDHLDGKLFIDHLTPLRRALSKSKLRRIERGGVPTEYKMVLPDGTITK